MLHSSGHQAQETASENSTIFTPILGVKWEGGMEKCGKNALMLEYFGRCRRYLDSCVALT
jgi:hypothetical protein